MVFCESSESSESSVLGEARWSGQGTEDQGFTQGPVDFMSASLDIRPAGDLK